MNAGSEAVDNGEKYVAHCSHTERTAQQVMNQGVDELEVQVALTSAAKGTSAPRAVHNLSFPGNFAAVELRPEGRSHLRGGKRGRESYRRSGSRPPR